MATANILGGGDFQKESLQQSTPSKNDRVLISTTTIPLQKAVETTTAVVTTIAEKDEDDEEKQSELIFHHKGWIPLRYR